MKIFKVVVFALLALNVVVFLWNAPQHEAFDQLGWVILLSTFLYETSALDKAYASPLEKYGLYAALAVGYGLAIFACYSYWSAGDTLGFLNSCTWLSVCAVLAYDVYAPGEYGGLEWRVRNGVKIALYAALVAYAATWAWRGFVSDGGLSGFLDFYDAALWIVCFAVIELNVFNFETSEEAPAAARVTAS
ncbi:hypothetical protein DFR50_12650 [Roseiarcus fermentans]|uniref:Uncharacterized protein n=1 Tax=Roseiarcus fermentans TaxID=1473586 RepID=A0A366F3B0_9HYPH|nr:hypothetical protein [Roseiarcus fermentans]RBP08205.1 hypothetical protein DFR50_12650 [Roseiarcus fermentans]